MDIWKPSRRRWFEVGFYSFMMIVFAAPWAIAILRVVSRHAPSRSSSTVSWCDFALLVFTVLCEGVWLSEVLWQILGRETLSVADEGITVGHRIGLIALTRKCLAGQVNQVDVSPLSNDWYVDSRTPSLLTFKYGVIAVKCGARTIRFGSGIDPDAAKALVEEIRERYPQYGEKRA
jgi:hypothetical protein